MRIQDMNQGKTSEMLRPNGKTAKTEIYLTHPVKFK